MLARIKRNTGRRGAATLEVAIAFIPLSMFLFGVFEYSRYQGVRHAVNDAARQACRVAVVGKRSLDEGEVEARVQKLLAVQNLHAESVSVFHVDSSGRNLGDWRACRFGDRIAVKVTTKHQPLFPTFGFLPDSVEIVAQHSGMNEVD